jgi:hypothetical protein
MVQKDVETATGRDHAEELRRVLERAEQGDHTVLPVLRKLLDANPQAWQSWGDLAMQAEVAWVTLAAGPNLVLKESLTRKLAALRAELAGSTPTPLVRLLVDRVVITWVQVHHADAISAQAKERNLSLTQLDHLQKRQERAQRGHLAAIKALATVQRLLPPVVDRRQDDEAARPEPVRGGHKGRDLRVEKVCITAHEDGTRKRGESATGRSKTTRKAALPKALRDRMRGLVGSEN